MSLLYATELRQSPINGTGVFALEDIPKGVVYWTMWDHPQAKPIKNHAQRRNQGRNRVLTEEQLKSIKDEQELTHTLHGGFYYAPQNVFIELNDGCEFMNHSEEPNSQVVYSEDGDVYKMRSITRKEIKAGEEITEYYGNYLSTDALWVDELMNKYVPNKKKLENHIITHGNKAKLQYVSTGNMKN